MKTLYKRKGKIITEIESDNSIRYKSINEAKKESRKIQQANGGLGRGSVMVEDKK